MRTGSCYIADRTLRTTVLYTNGLKNNTMVTTENVKRIFTCFGKQHLYNTLLTSYIMISDRRFGDAVDDLRKLDVYF